MPENVLGRAVFVALLFFAALAAPAQGQGVGERSGAELFRAACAACHGADGRGAPPSQVGFDTPLPDFTACSFASRETAADWFVIAHDGGPARSFDRRMPAFGEALTTAELERTIVHVRRFCADDAWPRGELNLPRALVTEKAYPEDEALVTVDIETRDGGALTQQFLYERRLGVRSQFEVAVPLTIAPDGDRGWTPGLGDVAIAFKHVLAHSLARGSIFSAGGEVVLPTGKESQGLGGGVTVVEPFFAFGQGLPDGWFVQAQGGAELSTNKTRAEHEIFWRTAAGRTFEQGEFHRAWTPMVEVVGTRELEGGTRVQWDAVPQVQVTLSRRQHILASAGVRLPVTERDVRQPQVLGYFLWDWFDGGLTEGWR